MQTFAFVYLPGISPTSNEPGMYLLGIDIGTSSIKVSVVDADSRRSVYSTQIPEDEAVILSPQTGWAEQDPDTWWNYLKQAILAANASKTYPPHEIAAIGIAYQMHGLVITDAADRPLRNAIIWCDSRAVVMGEQAFEVLGPDYCRSALLNSPGNFTASKLAWVKQQEPAVYEKIRHAMLPGDYIALKLTGTATTTPSALSEGIFWDFKKNEVSAKVLDYFGFDKEMIPEIRPVFSEHGQVTAAVAAALGLRAGIPVSYKAGDQLNNAASLNVFQPGEVAATAGTSGVIYGVSDLLTGDPHSRVNTFAHVNHRADHTRTGILLCINGTGILNRWTKDTLLPAKGYAEMNVAAATAEPGSNGLRVYPFGNGAERMLDNKITGAAIQHLDLNLHTRAHIFRAVQEGIAFAFRYGLDILRENGMAPATIRANRSNLFLSDLFVHAFVNATRVPVELFPSDASVGAAWGAGLGAGIFQSTAEAFSPVEKSILIVPTQEEAYEAVYQDWKTGLAAQLNRS